MTPPKVRTGPGSEAANHELGNLLNQWLENSGPNGLFRTCASCRRMARTPAPAFCHLYNVTPPIDVLLAGCDRHSDEMEPPLDKDIPY